MDVAEIVQTGNSKEALAVLSRAEQQARDEQLSQLDAQKTTLENNYLNQSELAVRAAQIAGDNLAYKQGINNFKTVASEEAKKYIDPEAKNTMVEQAVLAQIQSAKELEETSAAWEKYQAAKNEDAPILEEVWNYVTTGNSIEGSAKLDLAQEINEDKFMTNRLSTIKTQFRTMVNTANSIAMQSDTVQNAQKRLIELQNKVESGLTDLNIDKNYQVIRDAYISRVGELDEKEVRLQLDKINSQKKDVTNSLTRGLTQENRRSIQESRFINMGNRRINAALTTIASTTTTSKEYPSIDQALSAEVIKQGNDYLAAVNDYTSIQIKGTPSMTPEDKAIHETRLAEAEAHLEAKHKIFEEARVKFDTTAHGVMVTAAKENKDSADRIHRSVNSFMAATGNPKFSTTKDSNKFFAKNPDVASIAVAYNEGGLPEVLKARTPEQALSILEQLSGSPYNKILSEMPVVVKQLYKALAEEKANIAAKNKVTGGLTDAQFEEGFPHTNKLGAFIQRVIQDPFDTDGSKVPGDVAKLLSINADDIGHMKNNPFAQELSAAVAASDSGVLDADTIKDFLDVQVRLKVDDSEVIKSGGPSFWYSPEVKKVTSRVLVDLTKQLATTVQAVYTSKLGVLEDYGVDVTSSLSVPIGNKVYNLYDPDDMLKYAAATTKGLFNLGSPYLKSAASITVDN